MPAWLIGLLVNIAAKVLLPWLADKINHIHPDNKPKAVENLQTALDKCKGDECKS